MFLTWALPEELPIRDILPAPANVYSSDITGEHIKELSESGEFVMSEKQELIKKLLEMQKKFIDYEHENGVEMEDYFAAEEGHVLKGFRQEYMDMANKLVDMAHAEKGSHR